MTNDNIPGIQLQGDTGPRRLVPLPYDSAVKQYHKRPARTGTAYLPLNGNNTPFFSEHDEFCRLYVDDATAVRAVIELAASKYGVPLLVSGDQKLCRVILAVAEEMGIQVNSNDPTLINKVARQSTAASTQVSTIPVKPELDATTLVIHPIPDKTLVLFTPNNKDQSPFHGRVVSSTTVDHKVYRYRIALQPDGAHISSVYTDAGVFQVSDMVNTHEISEYNERPITDAIEPLASIPVWMITKEQYIADQPRMRLDLNMVNPGYKIDCEYLSPGVAGPFTTTMLLADKPVVGVAIQATFGDATVKKVSAAPQDISEHELIQAGKQYHRRVIVDAIMMGKQVPQTVKSGYPEVMPIINNWVKSQLDSAIPLPPVLYNEMQSMRGGSIYVIYNEQDDSYNVSHLFNGELHDHVTGVDIEGAQEAAQNLLGIASIKKIVVPTVLATPAITEIQSSPISVDLLQRVDIEKLIETSYEAGETDFIGAIQTSVDEVVVQANQQINRLYNLNNPQAQAELRLQEWQDAFGFIGEDSATAAANCKSIVIERDELKRRVAELEARILTFVDKSELHGIDEFEQEFEQE